MLTYQWRVSRANSYSKFTQKFELMLLMWECLKSFQIYQQKNGNCYNFKLFCYKQIHKDENRWHSIFPNRYKLCDCIKWKRQSVKWPFVFIVLWKLWKILNIVLERFKHEYEMKLKVCENNFIKILRSQSRFGCCNNCNHNTIMVTI